MKVNYFNDDDDPPSESVISMGGDPGSYDRSVVSQDQPGMKTAEQTGDLGGFGDPGSEGIDIH